MLKKVGLLRVKQKVLTRDEINSLSLVADEDGDVFGLRSPERRGGRVYPGVRCSVGDRVHRLSPRLAGLARRLLHLAAGHDGLGAGAEGL